MLDLKQYFEKIYLISCYHTKDRLDVVLPHLKENGIEPELFIAPFKYYFPQFHKFNTENVWPGKLSVACAFEQLLQKCILENTKTALFIEDDILLMDGWQDRIKTEWELDNWWYVVKAGVQTHFFGMKQEAMKEYLNRFAMNFNSIDFQVNMLKSVRFSDCLAKQRSIEGQIPSAIDVESDKYELKF